MQEIEKLGVFNNIEKNSKYSCNNKMHFSDSNKNTMKDFIDIQYLLELVDGDIELIKQLFIVFYEDNKDCFDKIKEYLLENRNEELRCELHRMEGVVGNLRCYVLVQVLETLHREVREGTIQDETLEKLEEEFYKVIYFMKQFTEED